MSARVSLAVTIVLVACSSCRAEQGSPATQPAATQPAATQPIEFLDAATIYGRLEPAGQYKPVVTAVAGGGQFDWSRGTFQVTGQAKATGRSSQEKFMAMRAAETVAKRNALLLAAGLPMGPGRRTKLPAGRIDASGDVRSFTPVSRQFDAKTLTATVTLDVPQAGLSGVVRVRPEDGGRHWSWIVPEQPAEPAEIVFIDARSLGLSPGVAPRLISPDGEIVFEPARPQVLSGSRHAYVYVRCAAGTPLAGGQFKQVIVLSPARLNDDSLELSREDLDVLARHANGRQLLNAGRAVIVLRE